MLLSPKEHEEFAIVREEVRRALATVAKDGENGVNAELEKGTFPCWGFPKSHPASRFADWGARSYVTRAVRNTFDLFGVLSGPRREVLRGRQVPVKPRLLEPETLGPAERKRARKHVLRARGTCAGLSQIRRHRVLPATRL